MAGFRPVNIWGPTEGARSMGDLRGSVEFRASPSHHTQRRRTFVAPFIPRPSHPRPQPATAVGETAVLADNPCVPWVRAPNPLPPPALLVQLRDPSLDHLGAQLHESDDRFQLGHGELVEPGLGAGGQGAVEAFGDPVEL